MTVRRRETDRSCLHLGFRTNEIYETTRSDTDRRQPFVLYMDSGEEHTAVVQRRVDVDILYLTKRITHG